MTSISKAGWIVLSLALLAAAPTHAQAAPSADDSFAAAVSDALSGFKAQANAAGKSAPAPRNVASSGPSVPCSEIDELNFTRFELTVETKDSRVEMRFRYQGCRAYPRNDYQPAYAVRTYIGNEGYDLLIVTDKGSAKSDLVMATSSKDGAAAFAGNLGRARNDKLRDGSTVDLGEVAIGVPERGQPLKGKAAIKKTREQGSPTDHNCDPKKTTCGAPPA